MSQHRLFKVNVKWGKHFNQRPTEADGKTFFVCAATEERAVERVIGNASATACPVASSSSDADVWETDTNECVVCRDADDGNVCASGYWDRVVWAAFDAAASALPEDDPARDMAENYDEADDEPLLHESLLAGKRGDLFRSFLAAGWCDPETCLGAPLTEDEIRAGLVTLEGIAKEVSAAVRKQRRGLPSR